MDEAWNLFSGSWSGKLPAATDESNLGGLSAFSTAHKIQKHAAKIRKANKRSVAAKPAKRSLKNFKAAGLAKEKRMK